MTLRSWSPAANARLPGTRSARRAAPPFSMSTTAAPESALGGRFGSGPQSNDFLELGPSAEAFLRAAAAAGTSRLAGQLAEIVGLERSWGREALVAALARALEFRRFRAQDVRSILSTDGAVPRPTAAGRRLELVVPEVPVRPLSAYSLEALR